MRLLLVMFTKAGAGKDLGVKVFLERMQEKMGRGTVYPYYEEVMSQIQEVGPSTGQRVWFLRRSEGHCKEGVCAF